ncbi:MAG: DUF11 domain-containing protein [Ardenticatenia bacterium]|nr:DUF11 domain-containing protein [Ardenticatenia bacterium]
MTKTESVDPVNAGSGASNLIYVVTLRNKSSGGATNVTVSEALTLPAGVSVVSITPGSGSLSGSAPNYSWSVPSLPGGASTTLTVVLTVGPSAAGGTDVVGDTATITGSDQTRLVPGDDTITVRTTVQRRVDIILSKTESADPVTAGSGASNLTYVVTARNAGPSDASSLVVAETLTLPAGTNVTSTTPGSGSVSGTAPNLNWTLPTLAAGANATLTVVLTVGPSTLPGTDVVGDTAAVASVAETRINTADDTVTVLTTVITRADLDATKSPASGTYIAGGANVSYTVGTTNFGPSDAQNVQLIDSLPGNGRFVSAVASSGAVCTTPAVNAVGGSVVCTWTGPSAPNLQRSIAIAISPCGDAACGSTLVNSVTAASGTTDPGPRANSASSTLSAQAQADLSVSKTGSPNPVNAGGTLTYAVIVSNAGPSSATGVVLVDTLPAAVTFVSATVSPAGPTCSAAGQVVTCNLGTVASSRQCAAAPTAYTVSIVTTVSPLAPCSPGVCPGSPGAPLSNTASVSTTNCLPDPNSANNSTTITTNVRAGSDLLLGVQVFHLGAQMLNLADLAALAAAGDMVAESELNTAQRAVLDSRVHAAATSAEPGASADPSAPVLSPDASHASATGTHPNSPDASTAPQQQADCIASGDFVRVVYTFSNTGPLAVTLQRDNPGPEFEADVPAQIALQQNTCTVSTGTGLCTVTNNGERVEWNGQIPVGGTVAVFYIGRIRSGVVRGDQIPFTGTVHYDIFNIGQNTASRSVNPPGILLIGCPVRVDPNRQLGGQVHLPILNFSGQDDVCRSMIEVQYLGCDPSKAVLVTWGEPGFCPPQAAGPLKVECTGLLFPWGDVDPDGRADPHRLQGRHALQVHRQATDRCGHRPGLRRCRGRPDVRDALLRRGG